MKYVAHRGLSKHYPENTLLSFQKAIHAGATAIELDVQQCRTGELVVLHDTDVSKTTTGTGDVRLMSLEEIKKLRTKDAHGGISTEHVPTLIEVLDMSIGVQVNIEIKAVGGADSVEAVLQHYIQDGRAPSDFLVSSFKKTEILRFLRLMPEVPTAVIVWGTPSEDEIDLYASWGVKAIHVNWDDGDTTDAVITQIHDRGMHVGVYTINTVSDAALVTALGADYIFTDDLIQFV